MVNWRITATTMLCTQKGNEVTIMVYKDGSLKCTGEISNYSSTKKQSACQASTCAQVKGYFDKLMSEEQHA